MNDREAQQTMVSVVTDWLQGSLATDVFVKRYWKTRRRLLDENWSAFVGDFGKIMSNIVTAVDSYSSEADRADVEIDEQQLRSETETSSARCNMRRAPSRATSDCPGR